MARTVHSRRRFIAGLGGVIAGSGCIGYAGNNGNGDGETLEIGVGSMTLAEQYVLAEMFYAVLAEKTTHNLFREIDYGNNAQVFEGATRKRAYDRSENAEQERTQVPREDLPQATERAFHVYPDYTGTMWQANPPIETEPLPTPAQQYEATKEQIESGYDLEILDMTPFGNSFEFAIRPQTGEETGIESVSDLKAYVNSGNYDITLGMQKDFYGRADGWPRLADHYGFDSSHLETWETEHDGIRLTYFGLESEYLRQGAIDIGVVFTTDPEIEDYNLQLLEDDRQFWPYYNITPVVATEVATEAVRTHLNAVIGELTDVSVQRRLNRRVLVNDESPEEVARSFLRTEGVL